MKLLFHLASTAVPGGSVRVLCNKLCWFARKGGYELLVVTTDQKGQKPYYDFPKEVRMIDLGINYWDDYSLNPIKRILSTARKRRLHRKRLAAVLRQERPDVTLVHYPTEAWVAATIRDGSKKMMEFHTSRYSRMQAGHRGLHRYMAAFRTWNDMRIAKKFQKVIVLTQEDAAQWGNMPGLCVIPDAVQPTALRAHPAQSRTVIAAGRLIPIKGFDKLLEAWSLLPPETRAGWKLKIFGEGMLEETLKQQIVQSGLQESASICPATPHIFEEYAQSAFLVMTSRYEGFGMVMVEGMSVGLPAISFAFKCGPRDIIRNGENGYLVPPGDVQALADAMALLMKDDRLREALSAGALETADRFMEDNIMKQWEDLFNERS